ncbi:MAG: hypothetical protein ACKOC5_12390 [Chloroflexota bacterium]
METGALPVVVFGFNRPEKLRRVLHALRTQAVDRLVVFIDGPRTEADRPAVAACQALARSVDWAPSELHLWAENRGQQKLLDNINLVLEKYPWAIILEDDCLPMPGFYVFMRRALERYWEDGRVFSIGGYQPLPASHFTSTVPPDRRALAPSARFIGWGWATWRERWQAALPDILHFDTLLDGQAQLSDIAGADLQQWARDTARGQMPWNWDVQVAAAAVARRQVHLLATRGLVRNIGMDATGIHAARARALRDLFLQNRNLVREMPSGLEMPEDTRLDLDYAAALRHFMSQTQVITLRRAAARVRSLALGWLPGGERRLGLGLCPPAGARPARRALLAVRAAALSIPRVDERFAWEIETFYVHEMVAALAQAGYCVDVIDRRDAVFQPHGRYDLFIGQGRRSFDALARRLQPVVPCLYLAIDGDDAAPACADGVIAIGASCGWSQPPASAPEPARAGGGRPRVSLAGAVLNDDQIEWRPRRLDQARRHFLCDAAIGADASDLAQTLEAFAGLPEQLWVIANPGMARRPPFVEFAAQPNIHLVFQAAPRSAARSRLLWSCGGVVAAGCHPGQRQALLEAMQQGLIPLASSALEVDLADFGFNLEPPVGAALRRALLTCAGLPLDELERRSQQARRVVWEQYAEAGFARRFITAVQTLLEAYAAGA